MKGKIKMEKREILINLKKDIVIIRIGEELKHEEIIKSLKQKLPELKRLYQDDKTPIEVTGKYLRNSEMDEIQKLIKEQIDVKIDFESPKTLGLYGIKKTFNKEIEDSTTKFVKNSLRNGVKIEYEGSVVVLGDVNAGAEIIAEDNIVILGSLRGLAHAGAKGNKKAIIAANMIDCPQIRIANIIKEKNNEDDENSEIVTIKNYAYVDENDNIVLE